MKALGGRLACMYAYICIYIHIIFKAKCCLYIYIYIYINIIHRCIQPCVLYYPKGDKTWLYVCIRTFTCMNICKKTRSAMQKGLGIR